MPTAISGWPVLGSPPWGDPRLARHVANTVLKMDSRGSRIVKESPHSPRKIDLAVGAVMAVDRAAYWAANHVTWANTIW